MITVDRTFDAAQGDLSSPQLKLAELSLQRHVNQSNSRLSASQVLYSESGMHVSAEGHTARGSKLLEQYVPTRVVRSRGRRVCIIPR